jgi:uncharacterized protein (DUF58 family)
VRIPTTSVQTSSRADWLVEFSIALIALAFLSREVIFAVVGAGTLLALASLGLLFHRGLEILRRELDVVERLPKTRTLLGDKLEGDLTIRNGSRLAARILAVRPVVDEGLSVKLSPSFDQVLRPGTASSSKFEIAPLKSGRFRISGFTLAFTDSRGLFTSEVNYKQADWVEIYPSLRTKAPITPLRLYGGSPEIFLKTPVGTDYAGIRQHTPGDEYHRVEWKATARLGTLMVKEFHPETRTSLQILIDAGRTMHEPSYVGTKYAEAVAVAWLLAESTITSGNPVCIWVYNEREILSMKEVSAEEQLANLQELSLAEVHFSSTGTDKSVPFPPASRERGPDVLRNRRVGVFLRLLTSKLGLGYRKTGVFKALTQAMRVSEDGFFIVLTDLQTDIDALLAAAFRSKLGRTVVAQIGAEWRLSSRLDEAFVKYHYNTETLRRLHRSGLQVFDANPEELAEALIPLMRHW